MANDKVSILKGIDNVAYDIDALYLGGKAADEYMLKSSQEWHEEKNFGESGCLLIGSFPMYDSGVVVEISATTSSTYHGTLVLATQNAKNNQAGSYTAVVYCDATGSVSDSLYIERLPNTNVYSIYFRPQAWSKNSIHIQGLSLNTNPDYGTVAPATNICEDIASIPATATIRPINAIISNYYNRTEVNNLIAPAMILRGTLGTGGTKTACPKAEHDSLGDMYKVITAKTYTYDYVDDKVTKSGSFTAKQYDTIVCYTTDNKKYDWMVIPTGDDIEDTWRPLKYNGTDVADSTPGVSLDITAGTNVTIDHNSGKFTFNAVDTGATSVEVVSTGNAVTSASYDAVTRKLTLSKDNTFVDLTSDQTITGSKTFNPGANKFGIYIHGAAADRRFITRGISGCTSSSSAADELYLNYGVDFSTKWGKTGQGSLCADGTVESQGYVHAGFTAASGKVKDDYLLLAGGGYKPISDFTAGGGNIGNYLPLSGGQLTGDLELYVNSNGDTPRLIFRRGTFTDNYNDWSLHDSGGYLYIAQRGSGSSNWSDMRAVFTQADTRFAGNLYVGATSASTGNKVATETWVTNQGYTTNTGTVDGTGEADYLAKWSDADTIEKGPKLNPTSGDTTKFLNEKGQWGTPTFSYSLPGRLQEYQTTPYNAMSTSGFGYYNDPTNGTVFGPKGEAAMYTSSFSSQYGTQIGIGYYADVVAFRRREGSTSWGPWIELATKSSITGGGALPVRLKAYSGTNTAEQIWADDATEQGWHYIPRGDANRPAFKNVMGAATDTDYRVMATAHSAPWVQQIATNFRSNDIFIRRKQNGEWQGWTSLVKMTEGLESPTGTTNAVPRWDGVANSTLKDSGVTIDDNNKMSVPGSLTVSGGAKISGRYAGAGDDEGLIIERATNGYAGLTLGNASGMRSVFYLMPSNHETLPNKAVWRYNDGTNQSNIVHPGKDGTIALLSDFGEGGSCDLSAYLPLAGGEMTGPIDFVSKANTNNLSKHYISAGGGYSTGSGLYGLKILALHQDNAQMGMGVDLTGGSYELTVTTSRADDSTASKLAFATHSSKSTAYKQLGYFHASGDATPVVNFYVNGTSNAERMIIKRTESAGQDSALRVVSTANTSGSETIWRGRVIAGAKNKTFIMGAYKNMCGLGAHTWSDSATEADANWDDFYLNPDGEKAVYLGGSGWIASSGVLKVDNSDLKAYINRGTMATPSWKEIAVKEDFGSGGAYDLSNYVTLDSPQTISGAKTFSNIVTISNTTASNRVGAGQTTDSKDDSTGALIVEGAAVIKGSLVAAGGLHLDDSTPQNDNMEFFLGINSFENGGKVHWVPKASTKVGYADSAGYAASAGNADTLDSISSEGFLRYYNHEPTAVNIDAVNTSSYLTTVNNGWLTPAGTKPTADHNNALGILHVRTHDTNYATQVGFSSHYKRLYARHANNESSFGTWRALAYVDEIPSVSNYVTLDTDQTISGAKSFTNKVVVSATTSYNTTDQQKFVVGSANSAVVVGGDGIQCFSGTSSTVAKAFYLNYYGGDIIMGKDDGTNNINMRGTIKASNYGLVDGTTLKASWQYNSSTDCVELAWA